MEHLARSPQRRTKTDYYQFQPSSRLKRSNVTQKKEFAVLRTTDSFDFAQRFSDGMQLSNMNEKELLQGLNDRFAGFTEKVRLLENQNKMLESEIEQLKQKKISSLSQVYDPEIKDLRKMVHEITLQKRKIEVEHQHLEQDFYILREKCEAQARHRSDAESSIMTLKRDINDAYLSKLELDKKVQSLVEEIIFLKKNHQDEVCEMMAQLREAQVSTVEMKDFGKADITAALRDIRKQLEGHASSNVQKTEECFRARVAKLTEAAEMNKEALQATRQEIHEHRRQLQCKSIELETVKGTKEALENQLHDLEERHDAEINHYQDTIRQLEHELNHTKCEMSSHLREYQDLLNVKMALDVEIASYRKLLEGEETRLSSVSGAHISVPYVYRQSPIYTLPSFTKHRGAAIKAEPQYKFVEEIITETTKELTEIEETGSEESNGEAEPTGTEKENGEAEDVAQMMAGAEVTAEEEEIPTAEEEQEEALPETADMERPASGEIVDTEEVIEGKASPEEETEAAEPADRTGEETEKEAKEECTKADKEETKRMPDPVEIMEPVKESTAEKLPEVCTDTIKAEEKEPEEAPAGRSPQQRDHEDTSETDEDKKLQPGDSVPDKKQEQDTKEPEKSPKDSPQEEEEEVQKVECVTAQSEKLEEEESPEKVTHSLTEIKGTGQPQATESPVTSQVTEPDDKEEGKAELVKEDVDTVDSSMKTRKDEQETTPVAEATSKESFKKESPFKYEEDSGKEKVAATVTDTDSKKTDNDTAAAKVAKEPEAPQRTEPIPMPKEESKSASTEKLDTEKVSDSKEKEHEVKTEEKVRAAKELTEEPMTPDTSTIEAKPAQSDKDKAGDKSPTEPEGSLKPEPISVTKEERSASTEKLDTEKTTDSKEKEDKVKTEQKGAAAKELADEPMTHDTPVGVVKPTQSDKDKAAAKTPTEPAGVQKTEPILSKEEEKSASTEKLVTSTDSKEVENGIKVEQKGGSAKDLTEEPMTTDTSIVGAKTAQLDKDKDTEKTAKEPEGLLPPKEESRGISMEKLDTKESTDLKEEVKTEQKEGTQKHLTEEPLTQDASTVEAKPAQTEKAAGKSSPEPEASVKAISLPKEEKTVLKKEESKDVKGGSPESGGTKDTEKITDGDRTIKEVGSARSPQDKESKDDMVLISDVKDKKDVPKKIKENGGPEIEENGFYESVGTTQDTTSTKTEVTKAPVTEGHAETIKEKTSEPKTAQ